MAAFGLHTLKQPVAAQCLISNELPYHFFYGVGCCRHTSTSCRLQWRGHSRRAAEHLQQNPPHPASLNAIRTPAVPEVGSHNADSGGRSGDGGSGHGGGGGGDDGGGWEHDDEFERDGLPVFLLCVVSSGGRFSNAPCH